MRKAISIGIVKRSHYTLASILLVAAVACGGDSMDPEVTECLDSTVSVTATVDVSGTAPVFDWVPACAVSQVFVEGVTEGDVWWIIGQDISPPITYGTSPALTTTFTGPAPLVRGRSYFLVLARFVDPAITTCTDLSDLDGLTLCRLEIHEFTW